MKATGIVRRIDDLGRVVIPKEIRRTLRIREGDPLEIFVDRDGEVILKKYSPIGELGEFAKEYADSLFETTGHLAFIIDRDAIVAVAGGPKKDYLGRSISTALEQVMEDRRSVLCNMRSGEAPKPILADDNAKYTSQAIAPIVAEGDPIGVVVLVAKEGTTVGEMELKLVETAAGFLAKQMEQ